MPIELHPRRATMPGQARLTLTPAADAEATSRLATLVIQVAAFAVVLAALPYPIFGSTATRCPRSWCSPAPP